jgi:hypothetical protein
VVGVVLLVGFVKFLQDWASLAASRQHGPVNPWDEYTG